MGKGNKFGYLKGGKREEKNADGSVDSLLDAGRFVSELHTGCPSSNSDDVGRGLASNMKVKPGGVRRFEHLHVPRDYDSDRHHDTPADYIQHPVNLNLVLTTV